VVVQSDKTLFGVVDTSYSGGAFSGGDNFNGEAYEAPTPATDVFLPYATEQEGDIRFSQISIQGTKTSGSTTVNLTYRDQNGNAAPCAGNPASVNIPLSRIVTIKPEFNCVAGNTANGSIRIQSTSDPVAVVFAGSWGQGAGWKTAYSGIPATEASNTLYYPNAFSRKTGNTYTQWSNIFIQNTSNQTVGARVRFFNTGAATAAMTFTVSLPPGAAKEYNTRFGGTGGTPSAAQFANRLGSNFGGTVIVEKTSGPNNALLGVAHNFWGGTFYGGSTYTAFGANDGGQTVYIPFSALKKSGNTFTQWDKVSIMNLGAPISDLTVRYYNTAGTEVLNLNNKTLPVPSLSVESINSRFGCDSGNCGAADLAGLGNSFEGTIVVSGPAGAKLVGIMNTLYPNRFNSFNALSR
jgi:hypothetical protein